MSRIIIKNLPSGMKEERLRSLFEMKGQVTDCSLKYTKDGHFRKFAFVGYNSEKEALAAIKHFHKSYVDTSRIQVEIAKDLCDTNKPRAWSKYSKESSAYMRKHGIVKENPAVAEMKEKKKKLKAEKEKAVNDLLGNLKNDKGFAAFLAAHERKGKATLWDNDAAELTIVKGKKDKKKGTDVQIADSGFEDSNKSSKSTKGKKTKSEMKVKTKKMAGAHQEGSDEDMDDKGEDIEDNDGSSVDNDDSSNDDGEDSEMEDDGEKETIHKKTQFSDLEYLKTKMTDKNMLNDSDVGDSDSSADDDVDNDDDDENDDSDDDDDDNENNDSDDDDDDDGEQRKEKGKNAEIEKESTKDAEKETSKPDFVIKLKGLLPFAGERTVRDFFKPTKTCSIKIPRNAKKNPIGIAYVAFGNQKDMEQAMRKNKNFIGGKRIFLKTCSKDEGATLMDEIKPRAWELKINEDAGEQETIAESGRIFVRNLPYTCTEEDLQNLFGKYGTAEVHLPVDTVTKKMKGFAFVTFMMPEHAVKAYSELDGKTFMGRLLHLMPSKAQKEETFESSEKSSFKKEKQAKDKAQASSSHNWNSLFLGANAVADVLSEMYSTSKSQILDAEQKQSLGVRMALGETQIVASTRDFLVENGVALDSFSQPSAPRSKTVLLVKNLPASTKLEELRTLFSKYGNLGRVLLPPSGVTAIIEYLEPSDAKNGFRNLAYTKFQHLPLYLEWAPTEVFKSTAPVKSKNTPKKKVEPSSEEESSSDEENEESQSTIFVKNLNFKTTEKTLKKKFAECGTIKSVTIAKKKDLKNSGELVSMGYGFVEFKHQSAAEKALQDLQHVKLEGHALELKLSSRMANKPTSETKSKKKKQGEKKQTTSKILVRNIPFEATRNEVYELFKVFGELKTVRLPKKMSSGSHRGFGFVDFLTKHDAKRAFEALCHSTHLYGRRLVLEWADTADDIEDLRKKTADHFYDDASGPSKRLKKSDIHETLEGSSL